MGKFDIRVNRVLKVADEIFKVFLSFCPSMNFHQTNDLNKAFSMACSNFPVNKFAYEGTMRVPIAVPCTCK